MRMLTSIPIRNTSVWQLRLKYEFKMLAKSMKVFSENQVAIWNAGGSWHPVFVKELFAIYTFYQQNL